MTIVQFAWESLSNSMRMYAEVCMRFHPLLRIDPEEAISNLDRAFESKMEAFHRLYDVTNVLPGFDYFGHADTALVIVLRNALHHRDHALFKSWNAMMHSNGGARAKLGAEYLLASYEGLEEGTAKYFLPLHDFYERLGSPRVKYPEVLRAKWNADLSLSKIAEHGDRERYPREQVYVDCIPIYISATQRVVRWLRLVGLTPEGYDSNVYWKHFGDIEKVDLQTPKFTPLRIL